MPYIVAWIQLTELGNARHSCEWFQTLAGAKDYVNRLITTHGISGVDVAEVIGRARGRLEWEKEPKESFKVEF